MTSTNRRVWCIFRSMSDFGIAFEGCAGKAAFHVGVVDWMLARGIRPCAVAGASSGSIIAAAIAAGHEHELTDVWMAAGDTAVFQPRRLLTGGWPFAMSDIVGNPVRQMLGEVRMNELRVPLAIPITQPGLRRHRRRVLTNHDKLPVAEAVMASCFLPGPYGRHVPIEGRASMDGAWAVRTPVDAVPQGPSRTIACVSNVQGHLIAGFFRPSVIPVPEHCRILKPAEPLPITGFDLNEAGMRASIELGRRSAEVFFRDNERWLAD